MYLLLAHELFSQFIPPYVIGDYRPEEVTQYKVSLSV
jgi:hypothetical protein